MRDAPVRLPPVPESAYTPEQHQALADFQATRNVGFSGPWHVFIRSPELLTHAQRMGEYLRYRCPISGRLSELTILIVARHWGNDYEFGIHGPHALKAGVTQATIDALREGRCPDELTARERVVWNFASELLATRRVSDTTYAQALQAFGEQGCVDLAGIVGYYSLLAMTMNVARVPPPPGAERLPRFPD